MSNFGHFLPNLKKISHVPCLEVDDFKSCTCFPKFWAHMPNFGHFVLKITNFLILTKFRMYPILKVMISQGVHVSWKTWKSWKCPGIFLCPGICPGIYHFQSFVLEISWKFFATVHQFFCHYFCQSSQHREIFGTFFTILDPIW